MVKAHYDLHESLVTTIQSLAPKTHRRFYQPTRVYHYMEANFLQDLLLEEYENEGIERGYQLPIMADTRKKPDKFGRIEDLEPIFARGLFRISTAIKTSKDLSVLLEQFLLFPNAHDDGPDAVEGGYFKLNNIARKTAFKPLVGNYNKNTRR